MLRFLAMLQRQIGSVAPAIRLSGEEGHAVPGFRGSNKGWEIGGQRSQGQLIDDPVPFVIPGRGDLRIEQDQARERKQESFHHRKLFSLRRKHGGKKANRRSSLFLQLPTARFSRWRRTRPLPSRHSSLWTLPGTSIFRSTEHYWR